MDKKAFEELTSSLKGQKATWPCPVFVDHVS